MCQYVKPKNHKMGNGKQIKLLLWIMQAKKKSGLNINCTISTGIGSSTLPDQR